jgi:hypothetical protein
MNTILLYRFYYEGKFYEDDIECHSYEEILTIPAVRPECTTPLMRTAVQAMKQFVIDFERYVRILLT